MFLIVNNRLLCERLKLKPELDRTNRISGFGPTGSKLISNLDRYNILIQCGPRPEWTVMSYKIKLPKKTPAERTSFIEKAV